MNVLKIIIVIVVEIGGYNLISYLVSQIKKKESVFTKFLYFVLSAIVVIIMCYVALMVSDLVPGFN